MGFRSDIGRCLVVCVTALSTLCATWASPGRACACTKPPSQSSHQFSCCSSPRADVNPPACACCCEDNHSETGTTCSCRAIPPMPSPAVPATSINQAEILDLLAADCA